MIARSSYLFGRVAVIACTLYFGSLSATYAIGPSNQTVPNPAPNGTNTLSSVVGVVEVSGGIISVNGTGTVINSYVDPSTNTGYLCVLTADHNLPGANTIVFPNYTPGMAPPATRTYPIIANRQVAGIAAGQNVDLNVVLVRYGTPDAFYFGVPDKTLTTHVGTGNTLAEIGFG
jgi:hypothetical protein